MKRRLIAFCVLLAAVAAGLPIASAQQEPTPEQVAAFAVESRQSLFRMLRFYIAPIAGMAQGAPFDAAVAERSARNIAALAPMIPDVLKHDTRGFELETMALDAIWDNQDDIATKAQALADNASEFADIASGGDMSSTLGAFRKLGGSCGNCHDSYKQDDD
jgi:cytochrome c556